MPTPSSTTPPTNSSDSVTPSNGDQGAGRKGNTPSAVTQSASSPASSTQDDAKYHPWNPFNWALWKRPKRSIAFILIMETIAIIGFAIIFSHSRSINETDWVRFAILATGSTVHIQLTRRQEERRRASTKTVLIDLTAVWTLPATLFLPPIFAVALIILIKSQSWFTARKSAHTLTYSTIAQGIAASLAHVTYVSLGPGNWETLTFTDSLREFSLVILAALVHELVQIIYVSGFLTINFFPPRKISSVLGSKADNILEAVTTGLGAINAVILVIMPPAVGIMALVTVVFNRLAELDQLQNDARTDPKTQVFNMRGWSEFTERALARAVKTRGQLAILMIDLDYFKSINDSYGHPAGDDVLRIVAQTIDEATRPSDIVGRFGGEEFVVLLPNTNRDTAATASERIRSKIAELRISTTDKRGAQTVISDRTTSIGIAIYPNHGTTTELLMHAADSAVYEAKEAGRNCVRMAPDTGFDLAVESIPTPEPPMERRRTTDNRVDE